MIYSYCFLDKIKNVDATFMTTCPSALKFLNDYENKFYIPNPSDKSFEILNNFTKSCNVDVFFALSHGVHRGVLKKGKTDDRINFVIRMQLSYRTCSFKSQVIRIKFKKNHKPSGFLIFV